VKSGCYFHPNENYPHEMEISTNLGKITTKIKLCRKMVAISAFATGTVEISILMQLNFFVNKDEHKVNTNTG